MQSLKEADVTGVDIFSGLTPTQAQRVASLGRVMEVPSYWVLGGPGEPGDALFIILDGKAELRARSALGEVPIRIAGPGETFPLAALVGSGELITAATAITDMELLAIPRAALLGLFAQEPEIGMRMYEAIAAVFLSRYRRTLDLLTSSANQALKDADFWVNV